MQTNSLVCSFLLSLPVIYKLNINIVKLALILYNYWRHFGLKLAKLEILLRKLS